MTSKKKRFIDLTRDTDDTDDTLDTFDTDNYSLKPPAKFAPGGKPSSENHGVADSYATKKKRFVDLTNDSDDDCCKPSAKKGRKKHNTTPVVQPSNAIHEVTDSRGSKKHRVVIASSQQARMQPYQQNLGEKFDQVYRSDGNKLDQIVSTATRHQFRSLRALNDYFHHEARRIEEVANHCFNLAQELESSHRFKMYHCMLDSKVRVLLRNYNVRQADINIMMGEAEARKNKVTACWAHVKMMVEIDTAISQIPQDGSLEVRYERIKSFSEKRLSHYKSPHDSRYSANIRFTTKNYASQVPEHDHIFFLCVERLRNKCVQLHIRDSSAPLRSHCSLAFMFEYQMDLLKRIRQDNKEVIIAHLIEKIGYKIYCPEDRKQLLKKALDARKNMYSKQT